MTRRILAPIALAAACAAAVITVTPRPAFALSDPLFSSGDDSGSAVCGEGHTVECGSTTTYKCISWQPQLSIGINGISLTYVCSESVTQTSKSYKD